MKIDIITIFPQMFESVLNESILKRAQEKGKVEFKVHDLRKFSKDKHYKVDDRPFGGGPGMVMSPQPLFDAIKTIKGRRKNVKVIYMTPVGHQLSQKLAKGLTLYKNLIIICGHYEGIDERVIEECVDECISIGDYILTCGELPAMVLVDCVVRLLPGVLGREESLSVESFENGLLEYPHYTRPAVFHGKKIPEVLLSGHHDKIEEWRQKVSLEKTKKYRPDLLNKK